MGFPVDVLEVTSHGELKCLADNYMKELLYSDPVHGHYFTLPSGEKIQLSLSNVGPVPLYGVDSQHNVLALFNPQDQHTVVALYLNSQWYPVEDILKTANSTREGLIKVRSVGERIVLYVLNCIVYRTKEMESEEVPFLCHSENEYAKILWKNGQAVGFYSVKPKGSVCNNFLSQCYFLPVMDSIFVRKAHRGKGYGLQMLEDFVDSFKEHEFGLKYPLSPAMSNVCRHFLDLHPTDVDLFWEVEVGGPYQKAGVAYILNSRPLNSGHDKDNGQNGDMVEDEVEESKDIVLNITEEIIFVNRHRTITEEINTHISRLTRSSEHKRRTRVRDKEEVDIQPDKIARVETAEEEESEFVPADGTETLLLEELDDTQTVDTSEEQQEAASVSEDNKEMEVDPTAHLYQKEDHSLAAEEDEDYLSGEATQEVASVAEKEQEVNPPAGGPSSSLFFSTHAEEEQRQAEVTDVVNAISEQFSKEKPSGGKENTIKRKEEEKAGLKEDMMDDEGDKRMLSKPIAFSMVLRGSRNNPVPLISKRTSKLQKVLEKEERGRGRTAGSKSGKRRQWNKHRGRKVKKRRGRRGRAPLRRGGAKEDPPVIEKRVLRRKTKVIQSMRQTRSKRQRKM